MTHLKDVILGEGDDLLDTPVLLEDIGEGVHTGWMGHVFNVDVQDGPARLAIIHELDEMARVGLGLGPQCLRFRKTGVKIQTKRRCEEADIHGIGTMVDRPYEKSTARRRFVRGAETAMAGYCSS